MKKLIVISSVILLIFAVAVLAFFFDWKTDQQIDKIDLMNQAEDLFHQTYPDYILESHTVLQQQKEWYILFTIKGTSRPEQDLPVRYYGYLQIKRSFDQYSIRDKQLFLCDPSANFGYFSGIGWGNRTFGLFLDPNAYRLELYQGNLLVATYLRENGNDFYFITLSVPFSEIDRCVCYDQNNRILLDHDGK